MPTQVLVYDAVVGRSWDLLFSDESMSTIGANWSTKDKLLVDLQSTGMFDGAESWDQLRPVHFKTLIARNFLHMDKLDDSELKNHTNVVVMSMSFLIGCLIKAIAERGDVDVELLKLRRINEELLTFDVIGGINKAHVFPESPEASTKGLRLAVDNTKAS